MRRTISGVAIAALASVTLLAGCADDATTTDPAIDDPAVEDTMEPMDDTATMEDDMEPTMEESMEPTMEPSDG